MPNWTKLHFELVSSTVKKNVADQTVRGHLCRAFAGKFQAENPLFKSDKFLEACGAK